MVSQTKQTLRFHNPHFHKTIRWSKTLKTENKWVEIYLPLAYVEYEGHANQIIPLSICEIFRGQCCRWRLFCLRTGFCSFEGPEQLSQLLTPLQPYLVRIEFHSLTRFPCLNISIVIPFPPAQHPAKCSGAKKKIDSEHNSFFPTTS